MAAATSTPESSRPSVNSHFASPHSSTVSATASSTIRCISVSTGFGARIAARARNASVKIGTHDRSSQPGLAPSSSVMYFLWHSKANPAPNSANVTIADEMKNTSRKPL